MIDLRDEYGAGLLGWAGIRTYNKFILRYFTAMIFVFSCECLLLCYDVCYRCSSMGKQLQPQESPYWQPIMSQ